MLFYFFFSNSMVMILFSITWFFIILILKTLFFHEKRTAYKLHSTFVPPFPIVEDIISSHTYITYMHNTGLGWKK